MLFEGPERLLEQFLGVVCDNDGLVGVNCALLICFLGAARALLGLLRGVEREAWQLAS